jgi:hypothetical protein
VLSDVATSSGGTLVAMVAHFGFHGDPRAALWRIGVNGVTATGRMPVGNVSAVISEVLVLNTSVQALDSVDNSNLGGFCCFDTHL